MIQQTKNEQLLLSATFTAKFELVCVFTYDKALSQRFHFNIYRQSIEVLFKNGTKDFQNSPPLERSSCFYVTISGSFEHFQYFNLETYFLKNKRLSQKTGIPFLVESTKIENAIFLCKTALSEAIVNGMGSTKGAYHK